MTLPWKTQIPLIQNGYAAKILKKTSALRKKHAIYPAQTQVFHALDILPFDDVRAVILGQDPYHGEGQAHGLAFSVPRGIKPPPSLKNIFKEIEQDTGRSSGNPPDTDLTRWAKQGVLLLNSIFTVEQGKPLSHKTMGWTELTDQIISELSNQKENLVFLLWGAYAQSKIPLIQENKHLILTAAHPSPFSAHRGFFGCRHFSRTNEFLVSKGFEQISW